MNDTDNNSSATPAPESIPQDLLDRIRPDSFTERDWHRLTEACEDVRAHAALGQLARISRRLL